jgi:hypothetical protein
MRVHHSHQPAAAVLLASNAGKSFDLSKARAGEQQTWFTMKLMSHAHLTSMIVRRAPMYRWVCSA